MVIVTNCPMQLGQNANLRNMVLATTNTGATSISGAADAIFGDKDNCGGGGAKVLTKGGMRFASRLTMHGSQLIAAQNIKFAAQGAGIRGASLVAGGEIDGTSNMDMAFAVRAWTTASTPATSASPIDRVTCATDVASPAT